ncbi:signal peptidase I [Paracoccus caeni]|uniref:Signal peptidase I n=1 Tax=Paracoccus caeni TaxID=657651 RepID=A0A934SER8_9RHOB|nr:signal peptidase I [Paracoccus caeni]MBK4216552.1 signal peptidase I [Paracoccus caeni]
MAQRTARKKEGIWETVKTVFWALIIAGIFRTLFFQPFWIPSGSMKDTLLIGDFLFVNKMAYGYSQYSCPLTGSHIPGTDIRINLCPFSGRILASEPTRGDVVVFRHPTANVDFIKRLIGMPGDRVQMRDGILYLNGEAVPQTPAGNFSEIQEPQGPQGSLPCRGVPQGQECVSERLTEALPGGPSHDILNAFDNGDGDNTPEFTVPEGNYFFLGDNRDNSADSRWNPVFDGQGVGMVPAEYIIGRADRIMFSSAGRSLLYFWTWRADRFLKAVD